MSSGHLDLVEYLRNNLVGGDVIGFGLVGESDAVAEYVVTHCTHIFGNYITALTREARAMPIDARGDAPKLIMPARSFRPKSPGLRVANTMSTI